jgi:hypothetical protein
MRNPLRSEAEAFRFVIVVIVGALVIVGASYLNVWVGVAAAVVVVAAVAWWLMQGGMDERPPALVSDTPAGVHRVLVLAMPGTQDVRVPDRATEVFVVVPALASHVEALTGAVDDRRADAAETATTLAKRLPNARGEIGADNPIQAIDDALRAFGADEIVIVGGDPELIERARERFALPVSRA